MWQKWNRIDNPLGLSYTLSQREQFMVQSHWLCPVPGQGLGLEPEQLGTIGVSLWPCSGAVWKVLHKTIQPICPCLSPGPCLSLEDSQCD